MASSLEGRTLGKYRVLDALGRGGMARVYRAYHAGLDRYVAIKVLRSDLVDDEEFLARFRREAQAVAGLRHPHIVQVFDFDVQDDVYYMVMELLEGDTLKARLNDYRLRGERMPPGEMTRILLDVLDALAYAHSEGMVHRDVKPANIMLTRRGRAVITDFGIAHIVGGTRHTAVGALMGTLNYIAPEQGLEGRSDARSDMYSLGIVFYEMLTQRTPFDADTPLAVLMKHLNDPLPLPRHIDPSIPEPYERVVLKALAKHPEDRYPGAEQMAETLRGAAAEARVQIPERVAQPFSFTTREAPGEAVAVLSGTARERIAEAGFADGETDPTLGERLAAEAAERPEAGEGIGQELRTTMGILARLVARQTGRALREATHAIASRAQPAAPATPGGAPTAPAVLAKPAVPRPKEAVVNVPPAPEEAAGRKQGKVTRRSERLRERAAQRAERMARGTAGSVTQAIFTTIGLLFVANLLAAWLAGLTGWNLFGRGWPVELFLVSLGLSLIMYASGAMWLLIPIGIILGNGMLFSYYSITGNWEHWLFLWPLEPLLIVGVVLATLWLSGRQGEGRPLGRALAWLLGLTSAIWAVLVALAALVLSWFV
jgi:tRNA A-37 threonylcarbamoyl transferase component Bud32